MAVRCRTFQKTNVESLKLKFQTVVEKTAKNFRGLLYFDAPGTGTALLNLIMLLDDVIRDASDKKVLMPSDNTGSQVARPRFK